MILYFNTLPRLPKNLPLPKPKPCPLLHPLPPRQKRTTPAPHAHLPQEKNLPSAMARSGTKCYPSLVSDEGMGGRSTPVGGKGVVTAVVEEKALSSGGLMGFRIPPPVAPTPTRKVVESKAAVASV